MILSSNDDYREFVQRRGRILRTYKDKKFANIYVIIAWLKEYDGLFLPMKKKLETLTEDEEKNYINNTIAITTENVVIKPSAWDAMPETAKQAFTVLFLGMADILALDGKPYNHFEKPSFDLFSI